MHEHNCTEIQEIGVNENVGNCNSLHNRQQKRSSLLNCEIQFQTEDEEDCIEESKEL